MNKRAIVWICVMGAMWCGCKEEATGEQDILHTMQAMTRAGDASPLVVSFGPGQGGVSKQALTQLWAKHPEWTRDQALDAAIRQELVWQSWDGQSLDEVSWRALHDARKRGMVNAWIAGELLTSERVKLDDVALATEVSAQMVARARPAGYLASHMLVRVPEGADEARVEAARAALLDLVQRMDTMTHADGGSLFRVLAELDDEQFEGFEVVVNAGMKFPLQLLPNELMPEGWTNVVPEFVTGAKQVVATHGFGKLSEPVKTSFGWHVIVVHERFPMLEPPREQVEAIVRRTWRDEALQRELLVRLEPLYAQYPWSSDPGALEDELIVQSSIVADGSQGEQ